MTSRRPEPCLLFLSLWIQDIENMDCFKETKELGNYFPSCRLGRSLAFKRKLSSMVVRTRKHWGSQVLKSIVLRAAFLEIAKTFWSEVMGVGWERDERKLAQLKMYGLQTKKMWTTEPPTYSSHQQPWQHTMMRKDRVISRGGWRCP